MGAFSRFWLNDCKTAAPSVCDAVSGGRVDRRHSTLGTCSYGIRVSFATSVISPDLSFFAAAVTKLATRLGLRMLLAGSGNTAVATAGDWWAVGAVTAALAATTTSAAMVVALPWRAVMIVLALVGDSLGA